MKAATVKKIRILFTIYILFMGFMLMVPFFNGINSNVFRFFHLTLPSPSSPPLIEPSFAKQENSLLRNELATPAILSSSINNKNILETLEKNYGLIASLNEKDFTALAQSIHPQALRKIQNLILSPNEKIEKRQAYLYLLSHLSPMAVPYLAEIASCSLPEYKYLNDPHSIDTQKYKAELSLRVTALESLDRLSIHHHNLAPYIENIEKTQSEKTLKYLSQISLAGIREGKPGKLERVITTLLTESGAQ